MDNLKKQIEETYGKTITFRVFVTSENIEKIDKIIEHLNDQEDVKSGKVERWTKNDVYEQLINSAIETYDLEKGIT